MKEKLVIITKSFHTDVILTNDLPKQAGYHGCFELYFTTKSLNIKSSNFDILFKHLNEQFCHPGATYIFSYYRTYPAKYEDIKNKYICAVANVEK